MTAADILRERARLSEERVAGYGIMSPDELRAVADLMEACWRKDECVCGAVPDEQHTERCPLAAVERVVKGRGNE